MNKEESLALYEKGVEAWNAWANEMLAKKAELEENKQWQIDANGKGINEVTREWINNSNVNFSNPNHIFDKKVDFSDFIFPYSVNFREVTFSGDARFSKVSFSDNAWFNNAKFKGAVWFSRASFSGYTDLSDVKFRGKTYFKQASFGGSVDFNQTTFESISVFAAIDGKGHFSFRDTEFHLAPDFNQAHFTEAPQFDDADFSKALKHSQSEIEDNLPSRWRALKRLAVQGHDHERELMFFAEEIKSQRGIQDKAFPNPVNYFNNKPVWPGGARYWLGYLYEYSSDFGRSVMRPIFWLLVLGFLFQVLYLKYPIDSKPQETISCDRTEAAIYLSVRNSLPFLPAASYSENLSRSYACLYGKHSDGKENVPNAIVFISIFQTILSTILIFLLLLALRNHFRIK